MNHSIIRIPLHYSHRAPANPHALAYIERRIAAAERAGAAHVWKLEAARRDMAGRLSRQQGAKA